MGNNTSGITKKQVRKMCKDGRKLIIVDKKVYDVEEYINSWKHPAGSHILLKYIGYDCTYHLNFHSKNAKKMLKKYYIEDLV